MDKKNKGLADDANGKFILNESGTSVTSDQVDETITPEPDQPVSRDQLNNIERAAGLDSAPIDRIRE